MDDFLLWSCVATVMEKQNYGICALFGAYLSVCMSFPCIVGLLRLFITGEHINKNIPNEFSTYGLVFRVATDFLKKTDAQIQLTQWTLTEARVYTTRYNGGRTVPAIYQEQV